MYRFLYLFVLFAWNAAAQKTFKIEGQITNRTESRIVLTIYRNWVEDPEDYYINIDTKNHFYFETILDETAYVDINYGTEGILFWIVEPGDDVFMKFDALNFEESLLFSGKGSANWSFSQLFRSKFELENDWEYVLANKLDASEKTFFATVDSLEKAALFVLDEHKNKLSENYFLLKRADVLGKADALRLQYYLNKNVKTETLLQAFNTATLNAKVQEKSFEYSSFLENYLESLKNSIDSVAEGNYSEYNFLKKSFEESLVKRDIVERMMVNRIMGWLEVDGYNEINNLIVGAFKEFSKNQKFTNLVLSKFTKLRDLKKGYKAPDVVFTGNEGQFISLKDQKGKYIYLLVWSTSCGPCTDDLKYLQIIKNYFEGKENLETINVAVDTNVDYLRFVQDKALAGISVRVDENAKFLKDYEVNYLPHYFLIDKNGMLIDEGMIEPALDEGRGLIKYLEKVFAERSSK